MCQTSPTRYRRNTIYMCYDLIQYQIATIDSLVYCPDGCLTSLVSFLEVPLPAAGMKSMIHFTMNCTLCCFISTTVPCSTHQLLDRHFGEITQAEVDFILITVFQDELFGDLCLSTFLGHLSTAIPLQTFAVKLLHMQTEMFFKITFESNFV